MKRVLVILLVVMFSGCRVTRVRNKVTITAGVSKFDFEVLERSNAGCSVTYEGSW